MHAQTETGDLPRLPFWVSGAAARPSGAPGFPALSSLAQAVPKPLFSVLELCGFRAGIMSKPWKNINIFVWTYATFSMKTLKNGKSLDLSLTIWKRRVHGCLLKAANVCPERVCVQTEEVLKDITYKMPTKRPLWRSHEADIFKPALQAISVLQTQLLLLLSSHEA